MRYPYGDKGRYVVLMDEGEYRHYATKCRYWRDVANVELSRGTRQERNDDQ